MGVSVIGNVMFYWIENITNIFTIANTKDDEIEKGYKNEIRFLSVEETPSH